MPFSLKAPAIKRSFNLDDFRQQAKRKLPAPLFHSIDDGADDEITRINNTEAFNKYEIVPRCLEDVTTITMKTKVLGCELDWPVLMSPTGMSRFFHHEGERAVARAAAQSGTMYSLSTVATTIENVAAATSGPKMFQLYVLRDNAINGHGRDRLHDGAALPLRTCCGRPGRD
ncbi:hypothetical protein A9Q88_00675 [Gammaproteobacteria bacterium 50_400_T64]|nr:hypothetical protein A9Q88_00675 [Gammaproteobacteria bacterium 50_400_T64]